jgi:hypothetical protein
VFAVPMAIGARVAADADNTGLAIGLSIGATLGFLIGAGCAAWIQQLGLPLSHGLVTAGATYLGAQLIFVAIRLVRGGEVRWFGILFTLAFVLLAGLIGGLLGQRLQSAGLRPSHLAERKGP